MINMSVEWNDLLLFLQVVERKGFTSAGEALGIPKSRLSRRVTLLEARLTSDFDQMREKWIKSRWTT